MKRAIFNYISTRSNSVFAKPKRFYKEVSVADEKDERTGKSLYNVLLDQRRLRTQGGKVLKVSSAYRVGLFLVVASKFLSSFKKV